MCTSRQNLHKERKKENDIGKRCVGNKGKNHEPQLILNFYESSVSKRKKEQLEKRRGRWRQQQQAEDVILE